MKNTKIIFKDGQGNIIKREDCLACGKIEGEEPPLVHAVVVRSSDDG